MDAPNAALRQRDARILLHYHSFDHRVKRRFRRRVKARSREIYFRPEAPTFTGFRANSSSRMAASSVVSGAP